MHTLGVISVLGVLSQLKMSNLDCWGLGEYVDTHFGVLHKNVSYPQGIPI